MIIFPMKHSPILRFWHLLSLYKLEIRHIYFYAILNGIVNLTLPLGIQAIINFIQMGEVSSSWIILVVFVLLGITTTGIFQILQLRIVENIQQDLFARSAFEFAYRIPKINFLQLDKTHAPELVNRFFDTLTIQKGMPKILIDFSLSSFQIVFGLILLAIYSPYFIILGGVLILVLWLIFQITGPKGLQTSLKESKYKYNLAHWLEEIARVNRSIKMNTSNNFHLEATDEIVSSYLNSREKHFQVLLNQFRLFIGFKVIVAAGLLVLGSLLVFQNEMNIGQFVAAEIIIILIINSVEKLLRVIETIYDVLTALEKIGHVTDLELDKPGGTAQVDLSEAFSVKAQDISFGFPDMKNDFIENLSFDIKAGEKVVLTGKTGSGKSTLLQLLAGIHEIKSGELFINKIPIASYDKNSYCKAIGMSFPSNQLFEASIRDNILMGRRISEKALVEILEILGLQEFVSQQDNGLNALIDSGGRRLPRSTIQKIHIARAIIGNPSLLLFEDPLQFVELEDKKRIIDYITHPSRTWTVIVIADNDYWQEKSTRVLELK